ncbi:MAG: diguanylate cyclase, partial [Desulfovibrionales bacterium]|nr:diguanylate cyclase [Desulfovibrionales bacterium]
DLKGKTVAVPEGFYYQEILEQHFPEIIILPLENSLQCLDAVSSKRADAALSEKPVFDYLINRYLLMELENIPILKSDILSTTPVSIGVSKDQEVLHNILQKSMDVVSREEVNTLREKWFRASDENNDIPLDLSTVEMQYLKNKESIKICVNSSWRPFEEIKADGRYEGMVAGIMEMLEKRVGLPLQVHSSSSLNQSLDMFVQGKCDMLSVAQGTGFDPESMLLSKPYLESLTVLVSRDQHTYIPDLNSIVWDKLAVVSQEPVKQFIEDNYPEIDTVVFDSLEQALKGVSDGEADLAIGSMHLVSSKIHEMGLYDLKIAGQTPYKEFFRVGVDPDQPELLSIIDKAIDDLSPQEINSVVRQWISIRYEQGIDYSLVWQIGLGAAIILSFFLYWNRKLFWLNQKIAEAHKDLGVKTRELEKLSITDSLTGTYNRMKIERILDNEILRVKRSKESLSMIMLDIDNFKGVNDDFGHQAGDMVLQKMASLLQDNIRRTDSLGRWGGEEFMVVCPHTEHKGAWSLAEKLRLKIMCADFGEVGRITGSFGVSQFVAGESDDSFLRRADDALYQAKNGGRNRTVIKLKEV